MTQPRAIILNGSPRRDGQTMALAGAVAGGLPGMAETVHLYEKNILSCRACMVCARTGVCPLRDEMRATLDLLEQAAFVVMASPLHFSSLSAPLIAWISRLQPYWQSRAGKGGAALPPGRRAGGLAVTAGAQYRNMFLPARSVALAAFNSLGIPYAGMVAAENTDSTPVAENISALESARNLAAKLVELLDTGRGNGTGES